jgi:hypothetical protein
VDLRSFIPSLISPVLSDVLKVLSGVATSVAVAALARLYTLYTYRRVRTFWRWFIGQRIVVIMTEYDYRGDDADTQFAQRAGGRYLVSRGTALALSNLLQFLSTDVTKGDYVSVIGDKSGGVRNKHEVVIGSPANNAVARQYFAAIEGLWDVPWKVASDPSSGDIFFTSTKDNLVLRPQIDQGVGTDYAMVVRCQLRTPVDRYLIMIAGAYMQGTQAAAYAVANRQVIDYVAKQCKGASNLMFMMSVDVVANQPDEQGIHVFNTAALRSKSQRDQNLHPKVDKGGISSPS